MKAPHLWIDNLMKALHLWIDNLMKAPHLRIDNLMESHLYIRVPHLGVNHLIIVPFLGKTY